MSREALPLGSIPREKNVEFRRKKKYDKNVTLYLSNA